MIAAVENAMIAQLKAADDAGLLGYEWRTLETYPDEFEAYLTEKGTLRTPAAWAVFLGMSDGKDDGDDTGWNGKARFALIVAAQNLRNEEDTRHGDGSAPGSYQLAIDTIRILSRNMLDLDLVEPITIRGARLVAISPQMKRQRLSLIAIECECRLPLGLAAGAPGDPLTLLHVDWDVPALGNVHPEGSGPLPADTPDAEDMIEVPQ